MNKHRPRIISAWLHSRRKICFYIALSYLCYFTVFALYGYPWGVAGYAFLLAVAVGVVFAVFDFARFSAKHAELSKIAGRFPTAPLPDVENLLEEDYSRIINELESKRSALEWINDRNKQDAIEYYTLWVHQIKTPIAAMRLLLQRSGSPSREDYGDLSRELFKIEQYVAMALGYQRLSSMQNDLHLQSLNVERLVKQAAKNCSMLFIHSKLSFLVAEDLQMQLVTDEKWFVFVLEQIFTNALKYTACGSISVYQQGKDVLVIEDTGVGIPAADLPRVFERGFTGSMGRNERSSTGIGLYLCREILHRLGFGIRIDSTEGQGTRVLLLLQQQELDVEL